MIRELVMKNRSCRRFDEAHRLSAGTLLELIDLARLSASAANRQPLKYMVSAAPAKNAEIFDCLAWAAYLTGWKGPAEGERPAGYIVILGDTAISTEFWCDHGIAAQSILLGAVEKGLAGCMIGAINKRRLAEVLAIDETLEIMLVLALGKPAETIVLETVGENGDIRYWRDGDGVHHVPKRKLDDLILQRWE